MNALQELIRLHPEKRCPYKFAVSSSAKDAENYEIKGILSPFDEEKNEASQYLIDFCIETNC